MFTPEDVQLFYQIVVHGRHELGLAPDEYSGFTMTLLRMLAFAPVDGGGITTAPGGGRALVTSALAASSAAAAAAVAASIPNRTASSASLTSRSSEASAATTSSSASESSINIHKPAGRAMAALKAVQSNKTVTPATSPDTANAGKGTKSVASGGDSNGSSNGSSSHDNTNNLPAAGKVLPASAIDWPALVKQLELRGVARQLAMQSELLSGEDDGQLLALRVRVPVETLLSAGSKDKLAAALSEHLGKKVRLDTEIGVTTQTAHAADVADEAERLRHAEQTLQEDPFVQTLIRDFGATIVPGSVRPL
jgi:DNA polymerase-3 subunit gamma/tau